MKNTLVACVGSVLVSMVALATERTWNGGGGDAYWTSAANWGGTAPLAGDALLFSGAVKLVNTNDWDAGTSFSGITFNSGSGAFILDGHAITLDGNISNLSTTAKTINLPMTLSADRTLYGVTAAMTVNSVLSGPGGLCANITNGTLTLTASNAFDGAVCVTNGTTLVMTNAWALGSTNGDTIVHGKYNARLQISGGLEIYEPITFNGQRPNYGQTLTCSGGSNTFWGKIAKTNEIRVGGVNGSTLVFAGGIQSLTSGGDVILNPGGGTFIFRDQPVNLGSGAFYLDQGGLIVIGVAGNTWGDTRAAGAGGTVRADVVNALPATTKLIIGAGHSTSGNFDLNGYDQTVGQLVTDTVNAGTRSVTSSKPATLTVNQTANTVYNGILTGMLRVVKNGTGTLTLTNGISTMTGDLVVNTGTVVIAQSAGFSANTNTLVKGGILDLRTDTALWDSTILAIADGAKVKIGAGLKETVSQLVIQGVPQARGTYGISGSGAQNTDNAHFDGTGQLVVLNSSLITPVSCLWDAEGGSDALMRTAANWVGDVAPLFDGTSQVVFGLAGSTAIVDVAVGTYGITFNRDGAFTLAAGSGIVTNGAGGISAMAPTASARTYTLASDMMLNNHQTWAVETNMMGFTTLNITGSIADDHVPCDIVKVGFGALHLRGSNTFDGTLYVSNGALRVYHSNALGNTNGVTLINGFSGCNLNLNGNLDLWEPLILNGEKDNAGSLRIDSGSNTLHGPVTVRGQVRIVVGTGTLVFRGGVYVGSGDSASSLVINSGTVTAFYDMPLLIGQKTFYTDDTGLTVIGVSGNVWGDTLVAKGTLRCDVPNALPPSAGLRLGIGYGPNGTLDLNGNDQTCSQLYMGTPNAGSRVVTSAMPATLTVNQVSNTVSDARFTGAVSLLKLGTGNLILTNAATSTMGTFTVNAGMLTLANRGTFGENATNIVVGGSGTLVLSNAVAIADTAAVHMPAVDMNTAKIDLAEGVDEHVGWLFYGDRMQRAGTYGSSDSAALYKNDLYFSGKGVLRVRFDQSGTRIILK